jgi:general secretion pathway protein K
VTVLPQSATTVNLNTAPAEVIYAVGRNMTLADAQRLAAERQLRPFRTMADVLDLLPGEVVFPESSVSISSRFFEVRGRLRLDNVVIEERSMVQRDGRMVRTLQRERGGFEHFAPGAVRR